MRAIYVLQVTRQHTAVLSELDMSAGEETS